MTDKEAFATSRRNVLRGSAAAGGLLLGSGLAAGGGGLSSAGAATTKSKGEVSPSEVAILTDYFLKIDGIKGQSQDATHQGWIDLGSYAFGVTDSGKPTTTKKGKVDLYDLHVTKQVDASSPALMLHCTTGKHIPAATLSLRASDGKVDYLTITLTEVLISGYSHSASENAAPTESISLTYGEIKIDYKSQSAS
jgi:type VI secretion system secreted protein Hcp